jgi:hypothetical protein
MVAWIEFEDHGITHGRLDCVWVVDKFAVIAHFDDVLGRENGSRKKEDKVKVVHFNINEIVLVVEYNCTVNEKRTVYRFWEISSQGTMIQGFNILVVPLINATNRKPRRFPDIGNESVMALRSEVKAMAPIGKDS